MKNVKYLSLREIQVEETNFLQILVKFLDDNGIDYYLLYGSLLGAVRHKGFIPWDDDIDIGILRNDYNKLISILKKNNRIFESYMCFSGWELNNSDWPYLKAINKKVFIECTSSKSDHYLYIDVFPLDEIPKNDKSFLRKIKFLKKVYWIKRQIVNDEYNSNNSKLKGCLIKFIMHFINYNYLIKRYIKLCKKYENKNTGYYFNNIWGRIGTKKIDSKEFKSVNYYEFEKLKIKSFKNYDVILKGWYGNNYMEIPKIEDRVSHSFKAWKED